jgi:DNA invertase Pin-like site-specific DNA recombinase
MAKDHEVGIYVRLSQEDSRAGESVSVENQKLMLTKHVKEMGWELKEIYVDDGWSGTNQNRPAFKRMIADVKQGYINTILIKDLSRLGRNYLEVGQLSEVFLPEHGCELISLNEKLDELSFLRNWFNEQHSAQTSKKVKTVKRLYAESGKFLGTFAPYGYKKDAENRHKLVIDEVTAPIVRRIFAMRAEGIGFRAIADALNKDGITSPKEYYYDGKNRSNPRKSTCTWGSNTVKRIIASEAYIGNTVQCKVGTVSYKNPKLVSKPDDEWIRAENTHEPLVSRELWERVQSFSEKHYKARRTKDGSQYLFAGLLHCADCGCKLRGSVNQKTRQSGKEYRHVTYICGTYARAGKSSCSCHCVSEEDISQLVAKDIRANVELVEQNEERIIETIVSMQNNESFSYRAAYQSEVTTHERQIAKLDLLIGSLYEDRVSGVVTEDMFKRYAAKYEQDRVDRLKSVEALKKRIAAIRQNTDNTATWTRLIKGVSETGANALDRETLLMLIDKIIIGESQGTGKKRVLDVRIVYRYVGDLNNLNIAQMVVATEVMTDEREAV